MGRVRRLAPVGQQRREQRAERAAVGETAAVRDGVGGSAVGEDARGGYAVGSAWARPRAPGQVSDRFFLFLFLFLSFFFSISDLELNASQTLFSCSATLIGASSHWSGSLEIGVEVWSLTKRVLIHTY